MTGLERLLKAVEFKPVDPDAELALTSKRKATPPAAKPRK
jgi:hypothetical protein